MSIRAKLRTKLGQYGQRLGISRPSSPSGATPYPPTPSASGEGPTHRSAPGAAVSHPPGGDDHDAPPLTTGEVGALVEQAGEGFAGAQRLGDKAGGALDQWETAESTFKLWNEVVSMIETFADVASQFGKIHPYVGAVTSAIDIIVKPIKKQHARDDAFEALLKELIRTYDLVKKELYHDAARVKKPANYQTKLLLKMLAETETCARFIKDEYIAQGFWSRTTKNVFRGGDVDTRMQQFTTVFVDLREQWRDEKLMYLEASTMLERLPRVRNAGHTTQKSCLPGTRDPVLRRLMAWMNDESGARAQYLVGVAGSGKSSIAHTIASNMQEENRLGSFFAFDRSETDRVPQRTLSTIAHDLALANEDYRDALIRVLKEDPMLASSIDIDKQWYRLILEPSSGLALEDPLLIVIDALDECPEEPDSETRDQLLQLLTTSASQLPASLRLLVTSRAESDIVQATRPENRLDLADFTADEDIHVFIRSKLLRPDEGGLTEAECTTLAEAADGLFQWAATACRFLTQKLAGTTVSERFNTHRAELTQGDLQVDRGRPSLNNLYQTVLAAAFFDTRKESPAMVRFRAVLALVLCATSAPSMDALQEIYNLVEGRIAAPVAGHRSLKVKSVLGHMGAVLEGTSTSTSPVRPMHASFREFLLEESRSQAWCILPEDLSWARSVLALGTVLIMARDLAFNMCDLPSSSVANNQVLDLPSRLSKLPLALSYSAVNFGSQISQLLDALPADSAAPLEGIRATLRDVLYQKFLFWLEFLNVTGTTSVIFSSLQTARLLFTDRETQEFIADALCFCSNFEEIIDVSAPGIYVSALPFTPAYSPIRQRFLPHFPGIPVVNPTPPPWVDPTPGITFDVDDPICVVCTSDSLLVSGTAAGLQLTDTNNSWHSISVSLPSPILCIAYSPTRDLIVAGDTDGSLSLWHPATLDGIMTVEGRHSVGVRSVCFTPNGHLIISASNDGTINCWDSFSGKLVRTLEGGDGMASVVCSPDGLRFYSAHETTIHIWTLSDGKSIGSVSVTESSIVCIAHSPKRNHLAVGLDDSTVQIWDTDTRQIIRSLLGASGTCGWLMWSPDDRYLVSARGAPFAWPAPGRKGVELWDTEELQLLNSWPHIIMKTAVFMPDGLSVVLISPFVGLCVQKIENMVEQSDWSVSINSVAYSADGHFIRAGCDTLGLRFWHSQTGAPTHFPRGLSWRHPSPSSPDGLLTVTFDEADIVLHATKDGTVVRTVLSGHQDLVIAGDISPDGQRLVTVSYDQTVRIWDLETHAQLGEPFTVDWAAEGVERPDHFTCVSFSPDGLEVVAGASDTLLRIWPIEPRIVGDRQESIYINYTPPSQDAEPDFKIPEEHQFRSYVWSPGVRLVLGLPFTSIDFANARLGTDWAQCYQPNAESQGPVVRTDHTKERV